jgi:hypothetical protein
MSKISKANHLKKLSLIIKKINKLQTKNNGSYQLKF